MRGRHALVILAMLLPSSAHAGDPATAKPPPAPAPPPPAPPPAEPPPAPPPAEPAPPADAPASEPLPAAVDEPDIVEQPDAASWEDTIAVSGSQSDLRSYAQDWLVAPPGYNIGGELRFITAPTSPDGPRIHFTDLALLRMEARWTASRRIELSGSVDLLAKQPDSRKDFFAQGGSVALKIATSRRNAIAAGLSGGPTMGDDGLWGSFATGVLHRSRIEEFLAFQYGGGAIATGLRPNHGDPDWLAGLAASSELVLHSPRGEIATWLGFDLEIPIVHSDALDPRSQLGVTFGVVFSAVRDWDLYTTLQWRDRGSTDLPATTLPIIDGGFDQLQFAVGLTRRFSERGKSSRWVLAL